MKLSSKIVKFITAATFTFGVIALPTVADANHDPTHGECSMTIVSDQHVPGSPAQASGACNGLVTGFYAQTTGQFNISGLVSGIVSNGQQYTIYPPSGEFISLTLTVNTVKKDAPKPAPTPKPEQSKPVETKPTPSKPVETKPAPSQTTPAPSTKPADSKQSTTIPKKSNTGKNDSSSVAVVDKQTTQEKEEPKVEENKAESNTELSSEEVKKEETQEKQNKEKEQPKKEIKSQKGEKSSNVIWHVISVILIVLIVGALAYWRFLRRKKV
ncbi:hypothetical protein WMO40_20860 [Bacillaceae bacterium CLA-AA-H227]|uniref:Uncharacterized protein n=1 Tax=Robertmurraya yapensis (ex Hitch et al 2024) TaxID=3133160 RepID=A0ACC6SGH3_9BACI|nr:hypothetical protein [Robertmurraya kyonggiensis]